MPDQLPIASIVVGDRHRPDHGDLAALAESIAAEGLLQPIGVTQQHELVFGERRLRACRDILGWTEIDVRVVNVSSIAAGEYHENEVRKDFTPSERVAILKTIERHQHGGDRKSDQEQKVAVDRTKAAKLAGFGNRETARQATRVVEQGVPELLAAMDAGKVSISRAAEIAKLPAEQQQERLQPLPSKAEPVGEPVKADWSVPANYGDRMRSSLVARGIWKPANAAEPIDPKVASAAEIEYADLKRYLAKTRQYVPKHPSPEIAKAMSQEHRREDLRKRAERVRAWTEKLIQLLDA